MTEETIHAIQALEEVNLANERALRLLSHRLRSEKELRARLLEKEFTPAVIDGVIEHLRNIGMIDDAVFARTFVHDQQLRKPAGRKHLQHQLLLKGVAKRIVENVLDEELPKSEEQSLALTAAMKHVKRHRVKSVDPAKQRQQLTHYLMRRGFSWAIISPVLKKIFHSEHLPMEE